MAAWFKYTEQELKDTVLSLYPRIIAYIKGMLGTDSSDIAEDLFYDVLTAFLEKKTPLQTDRVHAYLFRSVHNACLNHISRKSTARLSLPFSRINENFLERLYEIEFEEEGDDRQEAPDASVLLSFARELPPRTREVFIQSRIEGRKLKDIASDMGITVRAVQKHITISIKKFREAFPELNKNKMSGSA